MNVHVGKDFFRTICKLNDRKCRDESAGTFDILIEGERLIKQVTDYSVEIKALFVQEGKEYLSDIESRRYFLTKKQVEILTETENSQGVFAQVTFKTKVITKFNKLLYLNGISDPGNLGTIIRTATAFGVDGLIVDDLCCDFLNSKVVRASMGAVFKLPIMKIGKNWLAERKEIIIISEINQGTPICEFEFPGSPYILVIGNEANGVDGWIKQLASHKIYIPMQNSMESINVAVATGVMLWQMISG